MINYSLLCDLFRLNREYASLCAALAAQDATIYLWRDVKGMEKQPSVMFMHKAVSDAPHTRTASVAEMRRADGIPASFSAAWILAKSLERGQYCAQTETQSLATVGVCTSPSSALA